MKFLPDQIVARLQSEMQSPDLSGTRYQAIKFLGSGGMGAVWLVEDSVLHRQVAMKILAAESGPADLAARLMQEARILAQLEHPGIVPVHDAGTLADGRTFYCMKHVQGQTLDKHIAGLTLRQRVQLLQRIAEPLAFAHSRGIIHRDLKPGNIMIGAFGEVLIVDWGLAKVMLRTQDAYADTSSAEDRKAESSGGETTAHGSVLGTAGYMAPEQARGEVELIDKRTDVFGLGAIANFILVDQPAAPPVEKASRALRAVVQKARAAEMAARYASVQEMAADLGRYLEELPVGAYRENVMERAARLVKRHQVAVVLVLAYLLMRILFLIISRR